MIPKNIENLLEAEKEKFKKVFLQTANLPDFVRQEEKWIRNNLDFIYAGCPQEARMKVNPYGKFVVFDTVGEGKEEDKPGKETCLFLPRFLGMNEWVIHGAWVAKADKMITLLANYKKEFTFSELADSLFEGSDPAKRAMLEDHLNTLIRKFLSYQYVVIM